MLLSYVICAFYLYVAIVHGPSQTVHRNNPAAVIPEQVIPTLAPQQQMNVT